MDLEAKIPRKRVANFTTDEKALLAQLIKNKPIIEAKLTDGKSIARKHAAWELVTREFNCHANVTKRETKILKRAWDNMKALTRKIIRTGGGPQQPPPSSQHGAIISMVEDAAPVMMCKIKNAFDSDGTILSAIDSQELDHQPSLQVDTFEEKLERNSELTFAALKNSETNSPQIEDMHINTEQSGIKYPIAINSQGQGRRPADYIRREAVIRIKHLENKKRIETQILKTQLEVEEIKKRTALLEEERSRILLEKATMELVILKKSLQ